MRELHIGLQKYLSTQDWLAVATWLCMHFSIVFERMPLSFLSLTADDQVFQRYAKDIANLIA